MTWKIWTIGPALALAACAEEPATDEAMAPAEPVSNISGNDSTPSPAPGQGENGANDDGADGADGANGNGSAGPMAWNFATTAAGPKLTYGEPRTDNVRLMLRCAGGDRIALSYLRSSAGSGDMTIRSGGAGETAAATVERTQLGGWSVRAELAASAAPLQRFRGGSSLTVEYAGETRTVPPAGPEADRFFEAC